MLPHRRQPHRLDQGLRPPIPPAERRDWTWSEFVLLPDDDKRELIDGRLLEVDAPTELHEHIVVEIIGALGLWSRANDGCVLASGYKIKVSDRRGIMPDVQYFRPGCQPAQQGLAVGAPDLAVEVISPTSARYDRVTKLEWYRSIGTPEHWIVDPESRAVQAFVLHDGHWLLREHVALPEPDEEPATQAVMFRPTTFSGVEIDLERLFAVPE